MMLIQNSVNSDWLFNTQSRVLQDDWLILENNEKATLNISIHILSRALESKSTPTLSFLLDKLSPNIGLHFTLAWYFPGLGRYVEAPC